MNFNFWTGEGNSDPTKLMEALQKRVKRQENLLQKCKEVMRTHKERSAQLSSENETLQEQLQERLQELEKMKVVTLCFSEMIEELECSYTVILGCFQSNKTINFRLNIHRITATVS